LRGIDFRDKNKQTGGADRLERRQNQDPWDQIVSRQKVLRRGLFERDWIQYCTCFYLLGYFCGQVSLKVALKPSIYFFSLKIMRNRLLKVFCFSFKFDFLFFRFFSNFSNLVFYFLELKLK
jgi:hypothetical protein